MKKYILLILLMLVTVSASSYIYAEKAADPSGLTTGTITDVTAKTAGKPTLDEIGAQAGHNKIAINMTWL